MAVKIEYLVVGDDWIYKMPSGVRLNTQKNVDTWTKNTKSLGPEQVVFNLGYNCIKASRVKFKFDTLNRVEEAIAATLSEIMKKPLSEFTFKLA